MIISKGSLKTLEILTLKRQFELCRSKASLRQFQGVQGKTSGKPRRPMGPAHGTANPTSPSLFPMVFPCTLGTASK